MRKLIIFISMFFVISGCSNTSSENQQEDSSVSTSCKDTINIGVNIEFNSNIGDIRSGIHEWEYKNIDADSAFGGCGFNIIEYQADINNGTQFALDNLENLVKNEKVSVIIGPMDVNRINAIAPLAYEKKIPVIIPDFWGTLDISSIDLNEYIYIYRLYSDHNLESISNYIVSNINPTNFLLIDASVNGSWAIEKLTKISDYFKNSSGLDATIIKSNQISDDLINNSDFFLIYGMSDIAGQSVANIKSINEDVIIAGLYSTFLNYNFSSSVIEANKGINDDNLNNMLVFPTFSTASNNYVTNLYLSSPNMHSYEDNPTQQIGSMMFGFDIIAYIAEITKTYGTSASDIYEGINNIKYEGLFGSSNTENNIIGMSGYVLEMERGMTSDATILK